MRRLYKLVTVFVLAACLLVVSLVCAGCGGEQGPSEEDKAKIKEYQKTMNAIAVYGTTELTYVLTAWDFTLSAPDTDNMDARDALDTVEGFLGQYEDALSIFNITVTDQDVLDAFIEFGGDDPGYYDSSKPGGINTTVLGMMLAKEEVYSTDVAKYLFIIKNPMDTTMDYDEALKKASEQLAELEGKVNDEDYELLKQWYDEMEKMHEDIDNIPKGEESDYEERLKGYQEITKKCNDKFGDSSKE